MPRQFAYDFNAIRGVTGTTVGFNRMDRFLPFPAVSLAGTVGGTPPTLGGRWDGEIQYERNFSFADAIQQRCPCDLVDVTESGVYQLVSGYALAWGTIAITATINVYVGGMTFSPWSDFTNHP